MKSITEKINEELQKIPEPSPPVEIETEAQDTILLSNDDIMSWDNMNSSYKLDDYIIQPLDLSNIAPLLNTVSISGIGGGGTSGIGGGSGYQNGIYTTGANPSYSWNTLNPGNSNKVHITGAGIEMDADADITIGGRSMKKLLEGIEHRLSILVPDPKKLERYEALKQAYEHYQTLEALCNEEPKQEDK